MIDGLRPYAEMKASGLPWLGDVPGHWDVRRIKTLLREVDNRTKTGEERLLSLRMRQGLVDHIDAGGKLIPAESLVNFKIIEPGQVVMNRMRAAAGLFGVANVRGLVSPDYAVFEPMPEAFNPYLIQAFRLPSLSAVFRAESKGLGTGESGFLRLYTDRFGPIPVPYPPLDEQRLIVRLLDWHGGQTAKLIRAKKKIIALLNEQRQAIIHRAVTRGLDPNAKLKPSGISWLGDVPQGWEVKRLKWAMRLQRGFDLPADKRSVGPHPVVSSGGIIDHHIEYKVEGPGVVMGRYGSTDAVFYIEDNFWPHNTSLFVTDFRGNDRWWCFYVLRTISKQDHSSKAAVPGVDRKDLFDIVLAVPSPSEQVDIVRAIEEHSRELNQAITSVSLEIRYIQEFRTRLIADVVTGKLDVRAAAASLPEITELKAPDILDDDLPEDNLDEAIGDAEDEEVAA
ncbi:type I restriction enzyme, S subunit [Bradyrhizobium erythrophlei]|nr:type I restriction enzyme, S subunit [Bradyrhizobium erythrophlei]